MLCTYLEYINSLNLSHLDTWNIKEGDPRRPGDVNQAGTL